MNTEEEYASASQRLTRSMIGFALFEFVLIGLAIISIQSGAPEKIGVSTEFILYGVIVLTSSGLIPIVFLIHKAGELQAKLWNEIAEQYGYTYVHRPYFQNAALVFQEGRDRSTGHGLTGILLDRPFRFFQYRYKTGSEKHPKIHTYCVSEVVFAGSFPHIYLNNTKNQNLSNLKGFFLPRLSLPTELEKSFDLHGPKEYEIETLEIFTPDLLLCLLEIQWEHDLELADQKLYVFREKPIRTKQELEYEIERLKKLLEILAPKLNRLNLTPIGDHKSTL